MNKHTPGPWVAEGETISCATGYVAFVAYNPHTLDETRKEGESWDDMRVRTLPGRKELELQVIANTRLIAAAPELLDVLNESPVPSKYHGARGFETNRFLADYEAWMEKRRAAIAKAEGEVTP